MVSFNFRKQFGTTVWPEKFDKSEYDFKNRG